MSLQSKKSIKLWQKETWLEKLTAKHNKDAKTEIKSTRNETLRRNNMIDI